MWLHEEYYRGVDYRFIWYILMMDHGDNNTSFQVYNNRFIRKNVVKKFKVKLL